MPTPLEALDMAIGLSASQEAFAIALSELLTDTVTSPAVSQWRRGLLAGGKGVPENRCEPIEALTHGKVRVEELRPDLLWRRDPEGHVIGVINPITPTATAGKKKRSPNQVRD